MGRRLPPEELMLYKRCDEVLHYIWDPINIAGAPGARDEYESYLPHVFKILCDGAEENKMAHHLVSIEANRLGMSPNRERAERAAGILIEWRDWIAKHTS